MNQYNVALETFIVLTNTIEITKGSNEYLTTQPRLSLWAFWRFVAVWISLNTITKIDQ